jgi:hypothetical protein
MASNGTMCVFGPQNNVPPTANFATLDTRNNLLVLEFDQTTAESAVFATIMPRSYSGGGVTITVAWMGDGITTGDVVWGGSFERHQDDTDDLDADGFAAEQTATGTTASGSGEVQYTSIAFTDGAQMDSVAAGESFRFKLRRVATDGADTALADAQALAVEIRET